MIKKYTVKELTDILKGYGYTFSEKENVNGGISLWFDNTSDRWKTLTNDAKSLGYEVSESGMYGDNSIIQKYGNHGYGIYVRISKTESDKYKQRMGIDNDYKMENMKKQELVSLIENTVRKVLKEESDFSNYDMTLPGLGDTNNIRIGKDANYMYLKQVGGNEEIKLDKNQADNLKTYIKIHFLKY